MTDLDGMRRKSDATRDGVDSGYRGRGDEATGDLVVREVVVETYMKR